MARYKLTRKAKEDLKEIWKYTALNWSESKADLYYERFFIAFDHISSYPKLVGTDYSEVIDGLYGYPFQRHIIMYMVEDSRTVILRILHQRMDIKSRFQ